MPGKILEVKHLNGGEVGAKSIQLSVQLGRLDEGAGRWTEGEVKTLRGIEVIVLHWGPMQVTLSSLDDIHRDKDSRPSSYAMRNTHALVQWVSKPRTHALSPTNSSGSKMAGRNSPHSTRK